MILGTDRLASAHGAFADAIRVDARRVHRAPDGIDDTVAALTEPAAVAAHAVARSGQKLGDLIVVVGAGPVGLLVAQLARLAGAARVAAVDTEPTRQELACSLGADAAFGPGADIGRWLAQHGHGLGADVVYECAGHAGAVTSAVDAARSGGTVVLVGATSQRVSLAPAQVIGKELTLRASLGYDLADVHRALELMADDRFRVDPMCDRVIGFADLADSFGELASNPSAPRKVIFAPDG
jgi:(R,R)-butanediol dehydrogenase/meso-butanediol dehydrogenase/diacetyl reductase